MDWGLLITAIGTAAGLGTLVLSWQVRRHQMRAGLPTVTVTVQQARPPLPVGWIGLWVAIHSNSEVRWTAESFTLIAPRSGKVGTVKQVGKRSHNSGEWEADLLNADPETLTRIATMELHASAGDAHGAHVFLWLPRSARRISARLSLRSNEPIERTMKITARKSLTATKAISAD